jgi:hypothetical protein
MTIKIHDAITCTARGEKLATIEMAECQAIFLLSILEEVRDHVSDIDAYNIANQAVMLMYAAFRDDDPISQSALRAQAYALPVLVKLSEPGLQ